MLEREADQLKISISWLALSSLVGSLTREGRFYPSLGLEQAEAFDTQ